MARWLTLAALLAAPAALACINGKHEANPYYQEEATEARRLLARANAEFAEGDYKSALADAEDALDALTPDSPSREFRRARLIAGQAALKLGKHAAAERHLEADELGAHSSALITARLAEARVGAGKVARGRAALEELAKDDRMPDSQAWVALVRARMASGDAPGASEAAQEALRRDPNNRAALAALNPEPPPRSKAPAAGAVGVSVAGLALVLARRRGRPLTRPGA